MSTRLENRTQGWLVNAARCAYRNNNDPDNLNNNIGFRVAASHAFPFFLKQNL
jgi:formylglycine-generating enzyme required for sulfatase activity